MSARKRERNLSLGLSILSLVLIGLVGSEAWMFHKGTLVLERSADANVVALPASSPVNIKTTTNVGAGTPKHTLTVTATMAPMPASGKFEDIVLPAEKI